MSKKNVMIVAAHADDESFGVGGTIALHVLNGDNVHIVFMSDSVSVDGTNNKIIRSKDEMFSESYNAGKILGAKTIDKLPFKDLHIPFSFDSISKLESLIKQYNIDTIYTHHEHDANQDHIAAFRATMSAARYVKNVYCYEQIPVLRLYSQTFNPEMYVDISSVFATKIAASNAHKSQIKKYTAVGFDVIENLTTLAEYRGIQINVRYAEAFKVIKQQKEWN